MLREAPNIPVASVILRHNFPDHPGGPALPLASREGCDKDVDLTSIISGVVAVGTQDNTICTNTDIDTYTNVKDGEVYVVQAGGEEAAFTITHIGLDGTPTMVDQVSWLQANTYTPDVKAFVQGGHNYAVLSLERLSEANAACGVVFVDVTETLVGNLPNPPSPPVVHQEIGDAPETGGGSWCDVHNSFVETDPSSGEGRYVYLTADSTRDMRVLDISNIASGDPPEVGRYTSPTVSPGNYVHDITVINHRGSTGSRVYLSYWDSGLVVLNAAGVTPGINPNSIVGPNQIDPERFLAHHAWANQAGNRVFIQDEILNATGDEPVQMWDISDPGTPTYVDGLVLGMDVPVNPAHNLEIRFDIDPDRLYVGWNRVGLQAWDFSNSGFDHGADSSPRTAVLYHQVQTEPDDSLIAGTWGVRLETMGDDLYIFQSDQHFGLIVDRVVLSTPPSANDQTVSTSMGTPVAITLTGSLIDSGDTLSFVIYSLPSSGGLSEDALLIIAVPQTLAGATLTYTPSIGFIGTDAFTFMVNDGEQESNVATVTIIVATGQHVAQGAVRLEGRLDHAGARVTFSGHEPVFTGANGNFQVQLPAGTYTVTVESDGFLPATRTGVEVDRDVSLPTMTLLGGDVNGDGVIDADDLAIPIRNRGKSESPWPPT